MSHGRRIEWFWRTLVEAALCSAMTFGRPPDHAICRTRRRSRSKAGTAYICRLINFEPMDLVSDLTIAPKQRESSEYGFLIPFKSRGEAAEGGPYIWTPSFALKQ